MKDPLPDEAPLRPAFDLTQYGITVGDIRRNLSPAALYTEAIREDPQCDISDTGALIAFSGEKTGRSPTDKRVVEHPDSKDDVWWGAINVPIDNETFDTNRERAIDYLNTRPHLYVVDAFAGWDENYRAKLTWSDDVVENIATRCTEADTGARNIDNILSRTLLPELSAEFLSRLAEGEKVKAAKVSIGDGGAFRYEVT